jgi:hypothetical protein
MADYGELSARYRTGHYVSGLTTPAMPQAPAAPGSSTIGTPEDNAPLIPPGLLDAILASIPGGHAIKLWFDGAAEKATVFSILVAVGIALLYFSGSSLIQGSK